VRWFDLPELRGYLRITVGTPEEMQTLVKVARRLLR